MAERFFELKVTTSDDFKSNVELKPGEKNAIDNWLRRVKIFKNICDIFQKSSYIIIEINSIDFERLAIA